jgi:hypothetical protein
MKGGPSVAQKCRGEGASSSEEERGEDGLNLHGCLCEGVWWGGKDPKARIGTSIFVVYTYMGIVVLESSTFFRQLTHRHQKNPKDTNCHNIKYFCAF